MSDSASRRIRRRMFLRAVGLGLPVAAAVRLSRVALAQAGPRPTRFLFLFVPHGMPPEHFKPQVMEGDGTAFSLSQSGVSILGPLEEQLKPYVTVLQGIKYPEGAMTHEAIRVCLSGIAGTAGALASDDLPRVTLEHQIAAAWQTKALILGAVPHRPFGLDQDAKLMWNGTPVVPEKNPLAAYDAAFAGLTGGGSTEDPDVALTSALRGVTEAELEQLQKELGGLTAEQTKLKLHLESLRALSAGGGGGTVSCDSAPKLDAVEALRVAAAGQGDEFFLKEENFPQLLAAQLQIAGAALRCNARRVVAIQPMYANCELDFGFMGSSGPHHSALSHTQPQVDNMQKGLDLAARDKFAKAQRWFFEQLTTHALGTLLEPDPADPGRKVIDNTIVYVTSEIGEGAWHKTHSEPLNPGPIQPVMSYVPSVIIGGGGGTLKSGRVVTFSQDRPAGDVYRTLCQALGVTGNFPDAVAPVTEVLS